MLHSNVIHAEATAYRYANGRYVVTESFWPEDRQPEDALFRLGFTRSNTYHGGAYAVWQKDRLFVFVIRVGATTWTVEAIGLPNYVQFISENLGPVLDHCDRLPDGAVDKQTKLKEAPASAPASQENDAAANSVTADEASAAASTPEDDKPRDWPSCIAAIGVIDNGWRQCFSRFGGSETLQSKTTPRPVRPTFLNTPAPPDFDRAQRANEKAKQGRALVPAGPSIDRQTG